jgi:hypothetical protein
VTEVYCSGGTVAGNRVVETCGIDCTKYHLAWMQLTDWGAEVTRAKISRRSKFKTDVIGALGFAHNCFTTWELLTKGAAGVAEGMANPLGAILTLGLGAAEQSKHIGRIISEGWEPAGWSPWHTRNVWSEPHAKEWSLISVEKTHCPQGQAVNQPPGCKWCADQAKAATGISPR